MVLRAVYWVVWRRVKRKNWSVDCNTPGPRSHDSFITSPLHYCDHAQGQVKSGVLSEQVAPEHGQALSSQRPPAGKGRVWLLNSFCIAGGHVQRLLHMPPTSGPHVSFYKKGIHVVEPQYVSLDTPILELPGSLDKVVIHG